MSNIAEQLSANGLKEFIVEGDFLRLMVASNDVEIVYFNQGAEIARTGRIKAGYAETFKGVHFTSLRVYDKSGAANAIEFVYRLGGDVRYDRSSGSVDVTSNQPARLSAAQWAANVTNVSGQLVGPHAGRTYLLIQNRETANAIYLNLAGAAAVAAQGVKIPPGGSFELNCNIITNAIYAIGDAAAQNVIVVEA